VGFRIKRQNTEIRLRQGINFMGSDFFPVAIFFIDRQAVSFSCWPMERLILYYDCVISSNVDDFMGSFVLYNYADIYGINIFLYLILQKSFFFPKCVRVLVNNR
jgi:hypothetical protein